MKHCNRCHQEGLWDDCRAVGECKFEETGVGKGQGQLDFSAPTSRRTDPDTSQEAAEDAARFARPNRLLALKLLSRGAMTDYELAHESGLQQNSIGKRRGECMDRGLVRKFYKGDFVVKRRTPSGSLSIAWEITEQGRDFLERWG